MKREFDEALAIYNKGIKEAPKSILLLMSSAAVMQMNKNFPGAIENYKKILEIQPGNAMATNNYAVLLSNDKDDKQNLKEGLELASKLKDIEVSSFQDTYGWLSYLNGLYDQALVALEKSVNLQGSIPENHYHLALAYLHKGRTAEAQLELEKAVIEGANYADLENAKAELEKLQNK